MLFTDKKSDFVRHIGNREKRRIFAMYDPLMIQPMRDELTRVGFKELRTPEEVDALMEKKEGTSLIFSLAKRN